MITIYYPFIFLHMKYKCIFKAIKIGLKAKSLYMIFSFYFRESK